MKGDFHVRFRENVRVKFPCVTRLCVMFNNKKTDTMEKIDRPKIKVQMKYVDWIIEIIGLMILIILTKYMTKIDNTQ